MAIFPQMVAVLSIYGHLWDEQSAQAPVVRSAEAGFYGTNTPVTVTDSSTRRVW
jgi:hypothetical protein